LSPRLRLPVIFFLFILSSCATNSIVPQSITSHPSLDSKWKSIDSSKGEVRYVNNESGSLIEKQIFCDSKSKKNSQQLHQELLKRMSGVEIIFRDQKTVGDINTIRTHFKGIINKNVAYLILTTFKGSRCVVDVFLISQRIDKFETDMEAYNDYLESELNQFK